MLYQYYLTVQTLHLLSDLLNVDKKFHKYRSSRFREVRLHITNNESQEFYILEFANYIFNIEFTIGIQKTLCVKDIQTVQL